MLKKMKKTKFIVPLLLLFGLFMNYSFEEHKNTPEFSQSVSNLSEDDSIDGKH